MRIILIIISICISIQANSQAHYLFKNFKYKYSLATIDNQTYIDTVSFEFQLKNKYKKRAKEISAIIIDYGFINDSIYYSIISQLYKKDSLNHFIFKVVTKGRITHKRNNKIIYKIPLFELKIKELNYSFLSAWFFPEYHYIYAKEDKMFFSRDRLYFGSITSDQFYDKTDFYWKIFPVEKRNSSNFLNLDTY